MGCPARLGPKQEAPGARSRPADAVSSYLPFYFEAQPVRTGLSWRVTCVHVNLWLNANICRTVPRASVWRRLARPASSDILEDTVRSGRGLERRADRVCR